MKKATIIILKVLSLTIIYVLIVTLISGTLISLGFEFPNIVIDERSSFIQLFIAGLLSSLFVAYLSVRYALLKKWQSFLIVFFILFLSNISVAIEGTMFTPELITKSIFTTLFIQQLLISLLYSYISLLIIKRKNKKEKESYIPENKKTNIHNLTCKLTLCGITYMVMYYVWGWISYNAFTKPFYDLGISGLDIPSTSLLIKYIFMRGILITISIVPFLLFAQPNSSAKMYEIGAILFIFGGLLPLALTISIFPLDFIAYCLVEIFLQNFLTGIVIYKILYAVSDNRKIEKITEYKPE